MARRGLGLEAPFPVGGFTSMRTVESGLGMSLKLLLNPFPVGGFTFMRIVDSILWYEFTSPSVPGAFFTTMSERWFPPQLTPGWSSPSQPSFIGLVVWNIGCIGLSLLTLIVSWG